MISRHLIWLFVVIIAGILIATQPAALGFTVVVIVGVAVLSVITPLAAIIPLLVLAPLRTLIATEAHLIFPVDIGQIMLLVVAVSYLIGQVARRVALVNLIRSPLVYILIVYVLVAGFSGFGAISISAWLSEWLKWIQLVLVLVLVINIVSGVRWEWLVFGVVIAALANALIGIYEFFGGSGALHLLIGDRFFRAFGTFGQPNPFGGFMGLVLPLSVLTAYGYFVRAWQMRKTNVWLNVALGAFYSFCSVCLLAGVLMSWSRGAWLGLLGAMAVIVVLLPRNRQRGMALLGIVIGLIIIMWFSNLIPAALVGRIQSSTEEFLAFRDVRGTDIDPQNYAVIERLAHWQAALNMARERFWFGVGFGNYEAAYGTHRLINWSEPLGHAHNYYLNLLAETGVVGLLVYGKVWSSIFFVTWRASYHPDSFARLVVLGLFGSWVYLSIHSLFDNLYVNNLFLHLGLMLGILAVLYNQCSNHTRLKVSWVK